MDEQILDTDTTEQEKGIPEQETAPDTKAEKSITDTVPEAADGDFSAEGIPGTSEEETGDIPEDKVPTDGISGEIESLKKEIESLRDLLSERENERERLRAELFELSELFPGVCISDIPETVFESAKKGIPLAAAFALHIKKAEREKQLAEWVNGENAQSSAGPVGGGQGDYFSPDEVRNMTRAEVRQNYGKIIASMKKWG